MGFWLMACLVSDLHFTRSSSYLLVIGHILKQLGDNVIAEEGCVEELISVWKCDYRVGRTNSTKEWVVVVLKYSPGIKRTLMRWCVFKRRW